MLISKGSDIEKCLHSEMSMLISKGVGIKRWRYGCWYQKGIISKDVDIKRRKRKSIYIERCQCQKVFVSKSVCIKRCGYQKVVISKVVFIKWCVQIKKFWYKMVLISNGFDIRRCWYESVLISKVVDIQCIRRWYNI